MCVGAYNNAGYYHILIQNYNQSELFLTKARKMADEIYDQDPYRYYANMFANYTYFGMLYYFSGRYDKALETYKNSVDFASEIVDARPYPYYFTSYAELINNLGFVSLVQGDETTAETSYLRCIEKAKPFAEKNPYKHLATLCIAQINLGMLKLKQGRTDEFLALQDSYWNNVEKVYGQLGITFRTNYAVALDNKGYFALLQGDYEGALDIWNKICNLDPHYLETNSISLLYAGLKERNIIQ